MYEHLSLRGILSRGMCVHMAVEASVGRPKAEKTRRQTEDETTDGNMVTQTWPPSDHRVGPRSRHDQHATGKSSSLGINQSVHVLAGGSFPSISPTNRVSSSDDAARIYSKPRAKPNLQQHPSRHPPFFLLPRGEGEGGKLPKRLRRRSVRADTLSLSLFSLSLSVAGPGSISQASPPDPAVVPSLGPNDERTRALVPDGIPPSHTDDRGPQLRVLSICRQTPWTLRKERGGEGWCWWCPRMPLVNGQPPSPHQPAPGPLFPTGRPGERHPVPGFCGTGLVEREPTNCSDPPGTLCMTDLHCGVLAGTPLYLPPSLAADGDLLRSFSLSFVAHWPVIISFAPCSLPPSFLSCTVQYPETGTSNQTATPLAHPPPPPLASQAHTHTRTYAHASFSSFSNDSNVSSEQASPFPGSSQARGSSSRG